MPTGTTTKAKTASATTAPLAPRRARLTASWCVGRVAGRDRLEPPRGRRRVVAHRGRRPVAAPLLGLDRRLHVARAQRVVADRRRLLLRRAAALDLLQAHEDHRDVVAPAGVVGGVDELPARVLAATPRRAAISPMWPSLTIVVRPSLHSRKTSPSRAAPGARVDVDLVLRARARA